MSLNLEIVNPLKFNDWDDLIDTLDGYGIFHSSAWVKVIVETYQCNPVYFVQTNGKKFTTLIPIMEINSKLTGYRGVSLPFTDYCEPIHNHRSHLIDLINQIIQYGKKVGWKYFELRGGKDFYGNITPSCSFYKHELKLNQEYEQLFSDFRSSHKRNINKAIREGVEISLHNSLNAMNEFYKLQCLTRKKHGLPPQPFRFFKKIHEHVISKKLGQIVFASYRKKIISGAVFLNFRNKVLYKFGASDFKYQYLRANNLIMWKAIKWYSTRGYVSLNFGRTNMGNVGLRRFKLGWGPEEEVLNYYRYEMNKKKYIQVKSKETGLHNIVFRNIPIPISRIIGSHLYKHHG